MRPTFESIYMDLAEKISERSTCSRLKVGCVLVSEDFTKVLSLGYNGGASHQKNGCTGPNEPGKCECIHAEINALIKNTPTKENKILFLTHPPCVVCAKAIVNSGDIKIVYYKNDYDRGNGVFILSDAGIELKRP